MVSKRNRKGKGSNFTGGESVPCCRDLLAPAFTARGGPKKGK